MIKSDWMERQAYESTVRHVKANMRFEPIIWFDTKGKCFESCKAFVKSSQKLHIICGFLA